MDMVKILIISSVIVPSCILIIIGIFLIRHDRKKHQNCTARTKGTIIKYSFASRSQHAAIHLPIVRYSVNGKDYTGMLNYSYYTSKTSSFKVKTQIQTDIHDTKLKVSGNSMFMRNPLASAFPIGSELDVYYNPQKPEQNYVMRFTRSIAGWVCLWSGLGIGIFLSLIIFILVLTIL